MTTSHTIGRLQDKVAIVTGSSSGIGAAVAQAYAAEGAKVIINYSRNQPGAEAVVERINNAGGQAVVVGADVSKPEDVRHMVDLTHQKFGPVDILVNNAALLPAGYWDTHTSKQWDRMMAVNLKGAFLCTRAVEEDMKTRGYGKIINVSSVVFVKGYEAVDYTCSKAALIGFTRSLAIVLGPDNICVNSILPGLISPQDDSVLDDPGQWDTETATVVSQQLIKRLGRPSFTTGAFIFLASPESDFVTGSCLTVDGGYTTY